LIRSVDERDYAIQPGAARLERLAVTLGPDQAVRREE
jgi:hypothetical protein